VSADREHRPLLGPLYPRRAPEPVDADARQTRWVRVPNRGPWRLALLIPLTLGWLSIAIPALMAIASVRSLGELAVVLLILCAIGVPVSAVLVRAWVAGTYVRDSGVKVSTILRTTSVPWDSITAVRVTVGTVPWCGTPLRVPGERVVLDTREGPIPTTLTSASSDLWLRPQAWHAARDRLLVWWNEVLPSP